MSENAEISLVCELYTAIIELAVEKLGTSLDSIPKDPLAALV